MNSDKDWVLCFWENIKEFVDFFNDLIQELYDNKFTDINPLIVRAAGEIVLRWDKTYLINGFITNSYPEWDKILNKDVKFFAGNAFNFFEGLPDESIRSFQTLFIEKRKDGSPIIEEEDMDSIIDFFQAFVRCSIRYIHDLRIPENFKYRTDDGVKIFTYKRNDIYPDVLIEDLPDKWDVNLRNPF